MGNLDHDTADKLLDIHLRVVRQITCPFSGRVLDTRTAHLLTARLGEDLTGHVAIDPDTADAQVAQRLAENDLTLVERFDPKPAWTALRSKTDGQGLVA